jgi:hypothetical protein
MTLMPLESAAAAMKSAINHIKTCSAKQRLKGHQENSEQIDVMLRDSIHAVQT